MAQAESTMQTMPEVVIISGMSGAGRTEAMHVFEDLGYYCVDNLPPGLISNLLHLAHIPNQDIDRRCIAIVCDARSQQYFSRLNIELDRMKEEKIDFRVLFLDADDEKLIARYKSSRRRHPMCSDGAPISEGIRRERDLLFGIRERANYVIDTTDLLPTQLRAKINKIFAGGNESAGLSVTVYSFGFKHGAPDDADLVMDVRFLPNPYYDPKLRTLTGLDAPVRDFVILHEETREFLDKWYALLDCVMPGYVKEGKQQLAIAMGCTGGQHRSVALAEETGEYLKKKGYRVSIAHRDLALAERSDGVLVNANPSLDATNPFKPLGTSGSMRPIESRPPAVTTSPKPVPNTQADKVPMRQAQDRAKENSQTRQGHDEDQSRRHSRLNRHEIPNPHQGHHRMQGRASRR